MQSKLPAGPPPTPGQDDVTARRAGAATQSLPPADEDGPTAGERPDGGPREREQLFRATFDRAVIGIAHVSPEGRWLRVNQRLCDLLGYDRAELAARTWREITHPADLPADRAAARRLLAGELDAYELDTRFVRKDGALAWAHLTVSLVRTAAGAPDYFSPWCRTSPSASAWSGSARACCGGSGRRIPGCARCRPSPTRPSPT